MMATRRGTRIGREDDESDFTTEKQVQESQVDLNNNGSGSAGRGRGRGKTRAERKEDVLRNYDLVPTKPATVTDKRGAAGYPINLTTNYFRFKTKPNYLVLKYRVDFNNSDLDDQTHVKKRLLKQVAPKLPPYIFDGSMLFTNTRIFEADKDKLELESELKSQADDEGIQIVTITIKLVGEVSSTDHDYIHFFNILWRLGMENMELKMMNRNYYDPLAAKSVDTWKLEVWPGYITTIRQQEKELMLCAEISNKILRTDSALNCISLVMRRTSNENDAQRAIMGSVVITKYNNKSYRVDAVDFKKNPRSTFELKDKTEISYCDYFLKKYNIKIKDLNQPLLVSMPKDRDRRGGQQSPVCLIPELSMMTGLTDEQRSTYKLTQALSEWTRMVPSKRVETLRSFARRVTTTQKTVEELKKWDLTLDTDLVRLQGRVLPPEEITMARTMKVKDADWTRAVSDGMATRVEITKWVIISPSQFEQNLNLFFHENMARDANRLGITMSAPKFVWLNNSRSESYNNALDEWIQRGAFFFFVVIPNDKGDIYAAIKKKLCIDHPTPSQVITVSKVLSKKPENFRSVSTKVMIQMATKLKAAPWMVKIPVKNLMVVGFDTYHEKEGDNRSASVGAFVASYDANFTQYYSKASIINEGTEVSNNFESMLTECLKHYQKVNNTLPTRVFFYRDGVGQGQISEVISNEVSAIQRVLKGDHVRKTHPDGIKLTFIIVNKRINTRFMSEVGSGRIENPPSGTVVDDVVTCPERFDFFLVSQNVKQGTVNPTSYNVIADESGVKPDNIQSLTYKLTHLYFNLSSTVRVPAPCLYAHKLADLVGKNLKNEAHQDLNDSLYYI